jgi:hypothetical protein
MRKLSLILAICMLAAAHRAGAVVIGADASVGAVPTSTGTGLSGSYYKFGSGTAITTMNQAIQLISAASGPTATFTTAAVCYPNCNISTVLDASTSLSGFLGGNASGLTYTLPPSQIPTTIDHSALSLTGYIAIGQAGTYNFNLGSDDGAQLTIGNQAIIADNALHSFAINSGSATFAAAGLYAITIQYYENTGYTGLEFWGSDSLGNCALGRCNNTFAGNPFYMTVPGAIAAPEPTAVTTFVGGLAALAWVRRRSGRAI